VIKKELDLACWTGHIVNAIEKTKDRAVLLHLPEAFLIRWDSYV